MFNSTEIKATTILTIQGSPPTTTVANIFSMILNTQWQKIFPNEIQKTLKLPKKSIIILTENQLNHLATLRLYGFAGAVLLISNYPSTFLKEKYRILRWGEGTHDSCDFQKLPELLTKVTTLLPLQPENLKMLQNELKAPVKWLKNRVQPQIKSLKQEKGDHIETINEIALTIEQIRAKTPAACHTVVEINGKSDQIQKHFQRLIQQLHQQQPPEPETIAQLGNVFEQWRNIVLNVGEGLGTFS